VLIVHYLHASAALAGFLIVAAAANAHGQAPPRRQPRPLPSGASLEEVAYQALGQEYDDKRSEWAAARRVAKTEEERMGLDREFEKYKATYIDRLMALATSSTYGNPLAPLLTVAQEAPEGTQLDAALTLLCEHVPSLNANLMSGFGLKSVHIKSDAVEQLLRAVRQNGVDRAARGIATFDLARLLKNRGPERADEAEALFQEVREMYADVDSDHRPGGLAKWSEDELYALHNLIVGKVAPEIEDRDGDGKSFKLSDYRGKVVLLQFWTDPEMFHQEHELTNRLAGKPFAVLGAYNRAPDKNLVTWRYWLNGNEIGKRWNVMSMGDVFLLDAQGVIRYRNVEGPELDKAIDTLLTEVDKLAPDNVKTP
jgi:AhpC/TSA family